MFKIVFRNVFEYFVIFEFLIKFFHDVTAGIVLLASYDGISIFSYMIYASIDKVIYYKMLYNILTKTQKLGRIDRG